GYFLSDGTTRVNQNLLDIIKIYNAQSSSVSPLYESNIRYSPIHRKTVSGNALRAVAFETFDMMRGDDFKNALFKYFDDRITTSSDPNKVTYPYRRFDITGFIHIMNTVFPNSSLNANPLMDKTSSYHLPNDFLDKNDRKVYITAGAFTKKYSELQPPTDNSK